MPAERRVRMRRSEFYLRLFFFVFCITAAAACTDREEGALIFTQTRAESRTETEKPETADERITVYLCGAVSCPGVYTLAPESRLYEAVEAAGGLTASARADAVNLARVLTDGEQIVIPDQAMDGTACSTGTAADGRININQASVSELMTLPGIGEVKAQAIIDYRSSSGPFTSIEELKAVPGIKEAAFEKIRTYITVF